MDIVSYVAGSQGGGGTSPGPDPDPAPDPSPTGGIIEYPATAVKRDRLSALDIADFMPDNPGPFTFPAPYGTKGARITNATDSGVGGNDNLWCVGYSYWRNSNAHLGYPNILIFCSFDKANGGDGPTLFSYNKLTGAVSNLGPLFEDADGRTWHTGEGWYWSATQPGILYITYDSQLQRYNVVTKTTEVVYDLDDELTPDTYYLWQCHSSNDDKVHSATLRRKSDYAELGAIVYNENTATLTQYLMLGTSTYYDECQIDLSGKWLMIKENTDGVDGEDNRIIRLSDGWERVLKDADGAAGHSDMGYECMVAADNMSYTTAGLLRYWDFRNDPLVGVDMFHNLDWDIMAPGHESFRHAKPASPAGQFVLGSAANTKEGPQSNELTGIRLDESEKTLIIAPVMTDLTSGGGDDAYGRDPKANIDISGRYVFWTDNLAGSRLDLFLAKIPYELLGVTGVDDNGSNGDPEFGVPALAPRIALNKSSVPATASIVDPLDVITYTVTATISQLKTTEPVVITDTLSSKVTFGSVTSAGDFTPDISAAPVIKFTLPADKALGTYSATYTATVKSDATDSFSNSVVASCAGATLVPGTAKTTHTVAGAPPPAATLYKTSDCDGCEDAYAVSTAQLSTAGGYYEMTVSATPYLLYFALSDSGVTVPFSLAVDSISHYATVYVNDAYTVDTAIATGDKLRWTIDGSGKVIASKNGTPFWTSAASTASDPMWLVVYLLDNDAVLTGAVNKVGSGAEADVVWTGKVNTDVS